MMAQLLGVLTLMLVVSTLLQARVVVVVLLTVQAPLQQLVVFMMAAEGTEAPVVRPPPVPSIYLKFMRKLPSARRLRILLPTLI